MLPGESGGVDDPTRSQPRWVHASDRAPARLLAPGPATSPKGYQTRMLGEDRLRQRAQVVEALRGFSPGQIAVKVCKLILADVQCITDNDDAMAAASARRAVIDEWYGLIWGFPVSDADEGHGADAGELMRAGKVCTRCGTYRGADEYAVRKSARDGLASWCKPCMREHSNRVNALKSAEPCA